MINTHKREYYFIPASLAQTIRTARHIAVFTGAGVSAESGIPTFRDAQTGLWARYDPRELATPQAFLRNPQLMWEWNMWRRDLIAQAAPNPGHIALAELARRATPDVDHPKHRRAAPARRQPGRH